MRIEGESSLPKNEREEKVWAHRLYLDNIAQGNEVTRLPREIAPCIINDVLCLGATNFHLKINDQVSWTLFAFVWELVKY